MNRLDLVWDRSNAPRVILEVDGRAVTHSDVRRVVVVVDVAQDDPVVDVSHGTPLPLSLSDDGPAMSGITPLEFLHAIDAETLRDEVLANLGGLDGPDPVTVTLNTLRRWAGDGD